MVMVGHSKRLAQPLTTRQNRVMLAVLVCFVLAVLGAGLYATLHNDSYGSSSHGCVNVIGAGSVGAGTLHACGRDAAQMCRVEDGHNDALARSVQAECRKAGYPRSVPAGK